MAPDPALPSESAPPEDLEDLLPEQGVDLHPVRRLLSLVGGVLCILLGVVGWLVPVVTGLPFYALGILLLGMASRRFRRLVNRAERRLPPGARRALRRALRHWRRGGETP